MSNQAQIDVVQKIYAAFGTGDVEGMISLLDDSITFELPNLPGVPLDTLYTGKDGVRKFMADRGPAIEYKSFSIDEIFSDRDHVLVLGQTSGVVLATGSSFGYRWVQVFSFTSDNLVLKFQEFMDTHQLVNAFKAPK
ncbi:MAG: nuclear transport factor 2 family protein [Armatimonas sp.]